LALTRRRTSDGRREDVEDGAGEVCNAITLFARCAVSVKRKRCHGSSSRESVRVRPSSDPSADVPELEKLPRGTKRSSDYLVGPRGGRQRGLNVTREIERNAREKQCDRGSHIVLLAWLCCWKAITRALIVLLPIKVREAGCWYYCGGHEAGVFSCCAKRERAKNSTRPSSASGDSFTRSLLERSWRTKK